MGGLFSKKLNANSNETAATSPDGYSWDKRTKVDASLFTVANQQDQVIVRTPGSLNGNNFVIENCQNCVVILLDYSDSITIDDCVQCRFFFGAVRASVFFRDCRECEALIACQQFRSRNCNNFSTSLLCATQPIIESSHDMQFACLQASYPHFKEHLAHADITVFNNDWSRIHDFTKVNGESHYTLSTQSAICGALCEALHVQSSRSDAEIPQDYHEPVAVGAEASLVPLTRTADDAAHLTPCSFVVVFGGESEIHRVMSLVRENSLSIGATKQIPMKAEDVIRLIGDDSTKFHSYLTLNESPLCVLLAHSTNDVSALIAPSDAVHVASSDADARLQYTALMGVASVKEAV